VPKTRQKSRNRNQRSYEDPIARVQRIARHRADEEARRIPWQRLLETRNQYIDWQESNLWVRSVFETAKKLLAWLAQVLGERKRCPGLVINSAKPPVCGQPLSIRLEDWIKANVFAFTKRKGWFSAITNYAIRDPRYQGAEVCWAECVRKWKKAKPIRYPSFEEWKSIAANFDRTARLSTGARLLHSPSKCVDPETLAQAVSRLIDWQAFAYWARPALEHRSQIIAGATATVPWLPGAFNRST
jgi:hypothetical protein